MKLTYKSIVVYLGMIALVGCSSIEIAHDPLKCINRPLMKLTERMSMEEIDSMSDVVFDKVEAHIIAHKVRIKSQCKLINRHNKNHEGK